MSQLLSKALEQKVTPHPHPQEPKPLGGHQCEVESAPSTRLCLTLGG